MTFNAASFLVQVAALLIVLAALHKPLGRLPRARIRGKNVHPARAALLPARRDRRRHRPDMVGLPAQRPGVLGRLHPGRVRPPTAAGRPARQRFPARRGSVDCHEHGHFLCDQHELANLRAGDHGGHLRPDGPAGGAELPLRRRRYRRRRRPHPRHRPHEDEPAGELLGGPGPDFVPAPAADRVHRGSGDGPGRRGAELLAHRRHQPGFRDQPEIPGGPVASQEAIKNSGPTAAATSMPTPPTRSRIPAPSSASSRCS